MKVRASVFVPLLLAIATSLTCGGGDGGPDDPALGGYFADVQALNDEFESRDETATADRNETLIQCLINERRSRRRGDQTESTPTNEQCQDSPSDLYGDWQSTYTDVYRDWFDGLAQLEPPEDVASAHDGLLAAAEPAADKWTLARGDRFLQACDNLVKQARKYDVGLKLWCALHD